MNVSKSELVYNSIRAQIMNVELHPNTLLSESEICEKCQVSRTPVRQALQRLQADGLVECIPNKGVFVSELQIVDVLEIYRIREVLDPLALGMVMMEESQRLIEKMSEYLEQQKRFVAENDYPNYLKADLAFHKCYLERCPNMRMKKMLMQLSEESLRFSNYVRNDTEQANMSIVQHEAIFEAVKSLDVEAAKTAVQQHIIKIREYFKRKL